MEHVTIDHLHRIEIVVQHIVDNITEPLPLKTLAKKASMSQWHFQRLFKEITGYTVRNFIRTLRLAAAAKELLATRDRVGAIAKRYRFGSHEGFTRSFVSHYGKSPVEYRSSQKAQLSIDSTNDQLSSFLSFFTPEFGTFGLNIRAERLPGRTFILDQKKHLPNKDVRSIRLQEDSPVGLYMWHQDESAEYKQGERGIYYSLENEAASSKGTERFTTPALSCLVIELQMADCTARADFVARLIYQQVFANKMEQAAPFELMFASQDNDGKLLFEMWIPVKEGAQSIFSENFVEPFKDVAN